MGTPHLFVCPHIKIDFPGKEVTADTDNAFQQVSNVTIDHNYAGSSMMDIGMMHS